MKGLWQQVVVGFLIAALSGTAIAALSLWRDNAVQATKLEEQEKLTTALDNALDALESRVARLEGVEPHPRRRHEVTH